jgi:gliding motility-associated-like protein
MRKAILLAIIVLTAITATAQDFSNKGMEFWTCFPNHIQSGATPGQMTIWITSDLASSGTVTITNGSYSANFNVAANGIVPVSIPYANAHISNAESGIVIQKSIRIKVNAGQPPVVAYAQQYGAARSAATLLLPTNVLGKKYRAFSFTHTATSAGGQNSRSHFQIIATQPNTQVEITPFSNGTKGTLFTLSLPNVGDMYQYQASSDVTGTLIESIATGSGSCLPIAVFSGNSAVTIGSTGPVCNGTSYDPLFQQCYPITTWGKNYGFIPFGDYTNRGNPYRVMASEDNTTVSFNGTVVANLNAGQIYPAAFTSNPVLLNVETSITADKPISVAHYLQTSACSGSNNGDPDMVLLNPIEQNIKDITVFASTQQNINRQWINVLIQTTAAGSFKIDGVAPTTAFVPAANIPGYSYLRHRFIPAISGSHYLTADSGFNAILYGYEQGQFESYAYSAGTNVRDLTQVLELETTYGIETSPSVCTNSPFRFKFYVPDSTLGTTPVAIRFDSLRWNMTNPALIVPNNFPILNIPAVIDSTNIRNGRQVNWYSLPTIYYFTTPPVDTLLVTGYSSTNEGCGSTRDYVFPIQISDPPTASFNAVTPGCYLEPVVATETTPQLPKPTYKHWWEFYDPVTNITTVYSGLGVRVATHTFTTPGVKRIRHSSITTPGCLSDTIVQMVTLPDIPDATIAGNTAVCMNSVPDPTVTFTGSLGTAEYMFSYNINGGPTLTAGPSVGGVASVNAPTNVAGNFRYNLVGVRNANPVGTPCTRSFNNVFVDVIINPLPNAAIAGGTTVCLNGAQPPVTFTGSGGTAPYTFAYSINGTPQTPVVSNAAGVYVINAPTNVAGVFTYTITLVTDASSTICSSVTNVSTVITVNDLPDAAISGTTAVCLNAAQPPVTFTGSGGTAPYTFNYTINGVAQPPLVSNAAGTGTVNAPTNVAGTFTYALVSVQEGSPIACFRGGLTGNIVITVNPIPTAAIAGAITVCLNAAQPPVTFTGSGGTAPYTFAYTINGVPQAPVVSNAAGVYVINAPTNVAGTFNYTITQVTDASSTLCSSTPNVSTIITVNDLPDASIGGAATVCLNAAQPTVTFTGTGGTVPYTFNYTINGVGQPPLVSNAAGIATINAPTNVAGTFTYALVSVQEGSTIACIRTGLTGTTVINVNPLPTGSINGSTNVCLNAPSPIVTFTGSGSTAPYTFTYTINAVAQPPLVSNAAGIATIAVPTNVAGTFTYVLTNVQDASSTSCTQVVVGQQAVFVIYPLPTADFTYTVPTCDTRTITFTDNSVPNVGTITGWAWNFGDPASGGNNTSTSQNPVHIFTAPNTGPGYTVTLTVTTSNSCSNAVPVAKTVIVNHRPEAGFIVPDVCINDVATPFTDTSKIAVGTIDRPNNQWNYGDPGSGPNNTSVGINGLHLYTATGIYQVTQIVTSTLGCKDTIVLPITINSADPVSNFSITNSGTLCSSDSVSLVNLSTVGFGNVTRLEIYWDNVGTPAVFQTINAPVFNGVYKHKYPTLPTTQNYVIRMIAYSGVICSNQKITPITVYATPVVQFNPIPDACLLVAPYLITQGSEIGGVPGTGTYSGPGIINPNGLFDPQIAGIGTHTIRYTWTASNPGACIDTLDRTITVRDTAHAVFSFVSPSCEQVPTSFTDLSTAPASVVIDHTVWNFGDGSPNENHAPLSTFGHPFPGPGTYTVTMYNVSDYGCNSTPTSQQVTVDPDHSISTPANNIQTRCINIAIAPMVYTLGGGATGATVVVGNLPPGVTYTVVGTTLTISGAPTSAAGSPYNFTLETTGNSCVKAQAIGRITVDPDHSIALRAGGDTAQSVCINTAIDPIMYDLGGGASGVTVTNLPAGVTYSVTGNILTISGTPTVATTVPTSGYTITTTGNACLTASAIGEIVVHPYPVPGFTVDKPAYCIPNAIVKFTNTSTTPDGSGMTYVWNFGDGSAPDLSVNPTHWYASGVGPFTVNLSVTSIAVPILNGGGQGCNTNINVPMTSIHPQPKADFVFSKPGICIGDNVTITDNTDGRDGIVNQWNWDLGDGSTRNTSSFTYTYGDTITYNVKLFSVNSFGCNSDTITKPFTVYPYPHVNAGPDRYIVEGGTITLDPVLFGNDMTYLWTPNLYLIDNTVARVKVNKPLTDMTYRLTVTVRGGCAASDDVFVKLLKFPVIPNTFTPNNDGINDTWRIDYLNTYPNNRVQIFTRTGQLVFESRGYDKPWDGTLKGKPMPIDTYYYIIEPGNGRDPITGYVTILK